MRKRAGKVRERRFEPGASVAERVPALVRAPLYAYAWSGLLS